MTKILLVEDDVNLNYMVKNALEDDFDNYEVVTACNGEEGLKMWKEHQPKVIVADVDMPVMDGFEMVKKIRETDTQTLIIFLTAKILPRDTTTGLAMGANNYLKKPLAPNEISSHIKAIITTRESNQLKDESAIVKIGSLSFETQKLTLKDGEGNLVALTCREAEVMRLLVLNKGEVVRRNVILELCWEAEGDFYASRSLDVFISNLRKKLAAVDSSIQIKTVKGIGLSLVEA